MAVEKWITLRNPVPIGTNWHDFFQVYIIFSWKSCGNVLYCWHVVDNFEFSTICKQYFWEFYMGRVRPGGAARWKNNASTATEAFKTGVSSPRKSWSVATKAAEKAWGDGVTLAVSQKRFASGVTKAGDSKWAERTLSVGADRFASGVNASMANYEEGVAPYIQVLENATYPERYAKGDPRNFKRVEYICNALRKKKTG